MQLPIGVSDIYNSRLKSAAACSLVHQTCVLFAYLALVHAAVLHPVQWLRTSLSTLLALRTLLFLLFMLVVTLLQVVLLSKRYIMQPTFNPTRLRALLRLLALDQLFTCLLHLLAGLAMGIMYSSVQETVTGPNQVMFTLLLTAFAGVYVFIDDYLYGPYFVQLPPVPGLPARPQMKYIAVDCFKDSIFKSFQALLTFNMFYYCFGGVISRIDGSEHGLLQLLGVWRVLSSYILCLAVVTVLSAMRAITVALLASSWRFPVAKTTTGQISLSEALSLNIMPAVQQLASQDLLVIAQTDPLRRAELYLLSQPGGHPHNWRSVVKPFLATVEQMCTDLQLNPDPKPAQGTAIPAAMSVKIKDWAHNLVKKSPVGFLLGERTEAKVAYTLMVNGQNVCQLTTALSVLLQASYTEDEYGVVKQDLPAIIQALLKLKGSVERVGTVFRKQSRGTPTCHLRVLSAVREVTLQGLYRVAVTFRSHIEELGLTAEAQTQLRNFAQFKE